MKVDFERICGGFSGQEMLSDMNFDNKSDFQLK